MTLDEPCWICGIRHSDVEQLEPVMQKKWQLETHHSELEWAAEKAFEGNVDMLDKLVADLHEKVLTADAAGLREFLDSEGNMLVLCATHHRGAGTGIHTITYPVWKLQRWQVPGGFAFVKEPAA